MASSSDNFMSPFWMSERETETITRALQNSLEMVSGGSENETAVVSKRNKGGVGGVNKKRKSRASKRATTTFITADPANFRQMVQQVTGVRLGGMPIPCSVLKPEPQRPAPPPNACLPTLDTSAFFLNQPSAAAAASASSTFHQQQASDAFQGFGSFPTLESWN